MNRPYAGLLLAAALLIAAPQSLLVAQTLNIVLPDADTTVIAAAFHRIAANTEPGNRAFIDDEEVTVFESGAFVGRVPLAIGDNVTQVRVVAPDGRTATRTLVFRRPAPPAPLPVGTLEIDRASILPISEQWMRPGEVIEISFRGSPGRAATFRIPGMTRRIPMVELPAGDPNVASGLYVGRYVIQPGDEVSRAPVEVRLRGRGLAATTARSEALITISPRDTPRVIEVRGARPFMNAGLGTDRLGGARLGALVPGVRVRTDGRVGAYWRVRLGDELEAWLPEQFATLLPPETPLPRALVGAISVQGDAREDIVETTLPIRLPYLAAHRTGPDRIEVDLFGASSNTTWITQHLSAAGIDNVHWEQVGADTYRLVIELTHAGEWGYDVSYVRDATLRVRVRRPPVVASQERPLEGLTIVVDAGHGGGNVGALGASGLLEKDVALDVSRALERELVRRGATVVMTRAADADVLMSERLTRSLAAWPHLLVSVHANSIGEASDPMAVRGTSTYYRHGVFKPLSDLIYEELLQLGLREFGVIGSFNFALNQPTQFPNVLVETGFISHPEEEMLLADPEFQEAMAAATARGIEAFVRRHGASPGPVGSPQAVGGR
jgi:N-acetylmuramoyl-L-alanine amidase